MQSFEAHPSAVERDAELDRLGDQIAELSAQLDAAVARFLDLIRQFDERGGWGNGFKTCAHWLNWRVGLDLGAAREKVRVAHALATLPRIRQALAAGEISYSKARAVTRVATPETEDRLLRIARVGTTAHVEQIVRAWRSVDRHAEVKDADRQHRVRGLQIYQDEDGTVVVRGRLSPEAGAVVMRALEAGRERVFQQERLKDDPLTRHADPPTTAQQRADALVLLAETALHHDFDPGAPGERYQVVIHVDAGVLVDADHPGQSVLADGARVSAETSQRLACDASRVVMRYDEDGTLVEVGARTRTIPAALRRALLSRDRGCRFPGCGLRFVDGHHIQHWAHGGPTTLSNLALLCRFHHRAVHEEGYQVERRPDGSLEFRTPQGWPLLDVPPVPPLPDDPVEAFRATHAEAGLTINARTSIPSWSGERLDVVYAIDVLHPLATRPSLRTYPAD
jgi:hypothetical protein